MVLTVDDIARLAALMSTERLDALEYDGLVLRKSLHVVPPPARGAASPESDDDDETWSGD